MSSIGIGGGICAGFRIWSMGFLLVIASFPSDGPAMSHFKFGKFLPQIPKVSRVGYLLPKAVKTCFCHQSGIFHIVFLFKAEFQ